MTHSGNRSSKTFKPKKNIPEGSHQYELLKHAEATLGSGNLRMAVMLPEGEDLNEWVAVNSKHHVYLFTLDTPFSVSLFLLCLLLSFYAGPFFLKSQSVESELSGCKILAFPLKTMSIHAVKNTVNVK